MSKSIPVVKKLLGHVITAILVLVFLYALRLFTHAFLFDVFIIPTNSMLPTLQPGDRLLVCKMIVGPRIYRSIYIPPYPIELESFRLKGLRKVQTGDVVVFNAPAHDGQVSFLINHVYAKRCVALPGDSLMVDGSYYINSNCRDTLGLIEEQHHLNNIPDSVLTHEIFYVYPFDEHVLWTVKQLGPLYVPRKGDIVPLTPLTATYLRHIIEWELGQKILVDWNRNEVRTSDGRHLSRHEFLHNFYFMAGDNVCDSNDSRYWGLVPEEYIIGVATHVLYGRDVQTGRLRRHRIWRRVI
ncbi:MAG: signal peptidase I [Bacteroidaceae bacterium]